MANVKDVLIELLVEMLKEERIRWRKESAENETLVKELSKRLDKLETDLFLQRHIRAQTRLGRIKCDGEDVIDGSTSGTALIN